MKLNWLIALVLTSTLFSACLLKSFNPFFHNKDVSFNKELVGKWIDQDSSVWKFEKYAPHKLGLTTPEKIRKIYKMSYFEKGGEESRFHATLFSLDGKTYLDILPDIDMLEGRDLYTLHILPVHSLARIEISNSTKVLIKWYNEDWINELIENKEASITHQRLYTSKDDNGTLVLSASTDELQNFIRKYGDHPDAFDCGDKYSGDTYCKELMRLR